jgi:hypothetical protein
VNFFKQDAEASKRTEALNRIEEQSEQGQLNNLREKIEQQRPRQISCQVGVIEVLMPFKSLNSGPKLRNEPEEKRGRFWQLRIGDLKVESRDNSLRH